MVRPIKPDAIEAVKGLSRYVKAHLIRTFAFEVSVVLRQGPSEQEMGLLVFHVRLLQTLMVYYTGHEPRLRKDLVFYDLAGSHRDSQLSSEGCQ